MRDIYNSSTAVFVSMFLAFLWSIVYIYIMSLFAEYIAWGIIAITELGLIALTCIGFGYWATTNNAEAGRIGLLTGILGALATIVATLAIYCGWNSLKRAIDVIDASADFLAATKRIIAVPFLFFIVMLLFFFFWIGCIVCVYSLGKITPNPNYRVGGVYVP